MTPSNRHTPDSRSYQTKFHQTTTSTPLGPTLVPSTSAVALVTADFFIAVVTFLCWRRRNKRRRTHRPRRGGILGGIAGWGRRGNALYRTDTIQSVFGRKGRGRGFKQGSLIEEEGPEIWMSPQPSDPRAGYTGLGSRETTLVPREYQQVSPQPPPAHLKPVPIALGSATRASSSGPPFTSSSHSPSGSYEQARCVYYGISPTNSPPSIAVSISTPFFPFKLSAM